MGRLNKDHEIIRAGTVADFIAKRLKSPPPEIGTRSVNLVVTGYLQGRTRSSDSLVVQCDCGGPEFTVAVGNFKGLKSTRCRKCGDVAASIKRYGVDRATILYDNKTRWSLLRRLAGAIARCHVLTCPGYKHYGARGISVYPQWREDRSTFLTYIQSVPGWDNLKLDMDRINNNGNYEPGNIRFVSRSANMLNTRKITDLEAQIVELQRQIHGPDT